MTFLCVWKINKTSKVKCGLRSKEERKQKLTKKPCACDKWVNAKWNIKIQNIGICLSFLEAIDCKW